MGRTLSPGEHLLPLNSRSRFLQFETQDLDYAYSTSGDLPRYLPSLSFAPSYFHRVLRISGNPVIRIDLNPWSEEIAMNLQLLQDRVKTETYVASHLIMPHHVERGPYPQITGNLPQCHSVGTPLVVPNLSSTEWGENTVPVWVKHLVH